MCSDAHTNGLASNSNRDLTAECCDAPLQALINTANLDASHLAQSVGPGAS